jgi:pimeloyl-ACP methyl ester carboxylesterase
MKKFILFFLLLIFSFKNSSSQIGNSAYPVIFVHGLNSDDLTWSSIITQLSNVWFLSSSHTINAVLNARGGDTTNYLQDVIIPDKDVNGTEINRITPSAIYTINFNNFWNRNSSDPRIILYNSSTPGTGQSTSNQSAIYKQGYALKVLIDSVLRITGASKVILLGHSMGGLAIREYLQRKENGMHKWWIDPLDSLNGHKVAKVITIGTPHLGTNVTSIPLFTIDNNSEAMRDMRISFPDGTGGAYLFGNYESLVPSSYYNKDINCNGTISDTIAGLDSATGFNQKFPLPLNIQYTWITSNYLGLGTDLAVSFSSQSLYKNSFLLWHPAVDSEVPISAIPVYHIPMVYIEMKMHELR